MKSFTKLLMLFFHRSSIWHKTCNMYVFFRSYLAFEPFKAIWACIFLLFSLFHNYILVSASGGGGLDIILLLLKDSFRRSLAIGVFSTVLIIASVQPVSLIPGNVQVVTNPISIVLKVINN